MFQRAKFTTLTITITVFVLIGWFFSYSMAGGNEEKYDKIDKGLHYLREVFETIARNYVDEVDPEVLSKAAIEGMLENFDPYTVFFKDPGSQQMRMITRGKYGGVGMEISVQSQQVVVISPMEGSPAQRAGIRAGDIVTKIDGVLTNSLNLQDASEHLRGKVGTPVMLEFMRPGLDKPLEITLIREEITLEDVTYAGFVEPGTAYFRLSAFSDKASEELKSAIHELQADMPIQRVILDLRSNPGGLLTAAVDIANIFLPPGQLVVSTRGIHESEHKFYTNESPLLPDQPLVVLINESSASASEIVAGAIQDWDRGVLVGSETFGKGLVQKVYPIDRINQAYLKITTAKYYVPSGRCIQKEDYKKDTDFFVDHSDSTEYDQKVDYFTQNRRVVHGGGGIYPDVVVDRENITRFLQTLLAKGYFFQFTVDYLSDHSEYSDPRNVPVTDKVLEDFRKYAMERNFSFDMEGEEQLSKFLKIAADEKFQDRDIKDLVGVALEKLRKEKERQFNKFKPQIRELLIAEFAEKSGGLASRIVANMPFDNQLQGALQVLKNGQEYREILAIR